MKKFICLLITGLGFTVLWACYNETHVNKNGKTTDRSGPLGIFYNEPDYESARSFLKDYDLKKIEGYEKDTQSDIAVNLSYLGRHEEALEVLKRLQKKYPNDYNIAANLGTTYELVGKNESALQFIKKGIALNPDSHDGSEWVHVKILEAKLQIAKNPNWLLKNRVINTGVSFSSVSSERLTEKIYDIEYQLQERVPFTPFPDKILGNVFDELGDLYATQQSVELAYIAYDFSLQYDSTDSYGTKTKMEQLKPVLKKNKIPVPSWRQHYYNRKLSKLQFEIAEEVIDAVKDPERLSKTTEAVTDLWDTFSGNKAKREREERRNKTYLIGAGILAAALLGIFVLKRKKKSV